MSETLENLKKQFILDEDMEHENLQSLVERALKFCKVDKSGHVVINKPDLTMMDKIMLVLVARHLGNRLQLKLGGESTIKEEVTSEELAKMMSADKAVISARLKDLKDKKMAAPVDLGSYKVTSYAVDGFIKKLEGL